MTIKIIQAESREGFEKELNASLTNPYKESFGEKYYWEMRGQPIITPTGNTLVYTQVLVR